MDLHEPLVDHPMDILLGGIYGPILFPVYIVNDLNRGYMSQIFRLWVL
jgi:hypothetical protein